MADYLKGREYIRQLLARRDSQSLTNEENLDIKEKWDSFIGDLIDENITFNRVYTRVLENDDLRKGF
jgi:isocitrate dehydrogenase kinase/phosphatase